jgi:predicted O-linked N-acetylglucosamine transferase (SPINDLY family)
MSSSEILAQAIALHQAGSLEQAADKYRFILEHEPTNFDALHLLGVVCMQQQDIARAEELLCQSLELRPEEPRALYHLASLQHDKGDLYQAEATYARILEITPGYSQALNNYAGVLSELGRKDEAIKVLSKAIVEDAHNTQAYKNIGQLLRQQGRHQEALVFLGEAVTQDPRYDEAYWELSQVLSDLGLEKEAMQALESSLQEGKRDIPSHARLADLYLKAGALQDAIEQYSLGLELDPENPHMMNNLGLAYLRQGRVSQAMKAHRDAFELRTTSAMYHSNLLLDLNYVQGISKKDVFRLHADWDNVHAAHVLRFDHSFSHPGSRIRIGYVSPDFRKHSVSYFAYPLLAHHNRQDFEIFCYSDVRKEDRVSREIQDLVDHWIPVWDMSDPELARRIHGDGIDILVDMAGHTGQNRLLAFARKPAPIQVSWLGYPNTTGLETMDYRLTDVVADPEGEEAYHSEELVRLPHGFLCYQPDPDTPEVGPLPCEQNGYVTFGSFNNLAKMHAGVIELWAAVLRFVPNSRLMLKSIFMDDPKTAERILSQFADQGIASSRIDILSRYPSKYEHFDAYNRMDIGLDPFPYNGTTTTFEALWMGVPVITLKCERHAGRVGASILENLGLDRLVAGSEKEYIQLAQNLASSPQIMTRFRAGMRESLASSLFMNGKKFAQKMEEFYRWAWNKHNAFSSCDNIVIG